MRIHALARWLAIPGLAALTVSSPVNPTEAHEDQPQRLGVVVSTYRGDLERAVASLSRWPSSNCSPLIQQNVDLVLYYGEGQEDSAAVTAAADAISQTAGRCFATTRIVYADLAAEDDVYPKGPSVMFYKMFLDENVRSSLSEYDALSILEWDVLVASDRSFEQLYHAAFRTAEEFWVKGSNLEGTSFHSSAEMSDMWHVLGHINGNAIYNNNDPAFVEYVDYTRARWQYEHPYDVALWLTISDFPYSWPLYQRYSNKFVVTNLISYVGNARVDHDTVSDAVAGETLFIHGRNVDDGSKVALDTLAATAPVSASPKSFSTDQRKRKRRQRKQRRLSRGRALAGEEEQRATVTKSLARQTRNLQKWKTEEKWKTLETPKWETEEKWKGDDEEEVEPKWQVTEKWKDESESEDDDQVVDGDEGDDDGESGEGDDGESGDESSSDCTSGCEYTSNDGTRGRVCDSNCADASAYGTLGCSAKSGLYGSNCRACYNDQTKALNNDSPDDRAIMCATVEPVDVYARRRLSATADVESVSRVARMLQRETVEADPAAAFFTEAAGRPFIGDVTRGNLCAFIAGRADEAEMWEVTTKSILEFVPGMRVAIAAESEGFGEYDRLMGGLPGVTVSRADDITTAGLFADQSCGLGTSLILYVKPGSVLSRSFTAKDTHSVQGELLVVYGGAQGSYHDSQLSRRTAHLLGLEAPSFTHGTDLMLPASINADLRDALGFGLDDSADGSQRNGAAMVLGLQGLLEFDQVSAVPQMLAALAYSRDTPGVWFLDPQTWVSHHLFKEASIWEIPLVKPRYTCNLAPKFLETPAVHQVAGVLQDNLEFFARGGKCDNGVIDFLPEE